MDKMARHLHQVININLLEYPPQNNIILFCGRKAENQNIH